MPELIYIYFFTFKILVKKINLINMSVFRENNYLF